MRKWILGAIVAALISDVSLCGQGRGVGEAAVRSAFERGGAAMRAGDMVGAEREFRTVVSLAPDMAEAHLDLGLVLGREGKGAEAVLSLRRAVALDQKLPSAHMFLGIFLYQGGDREGAVRALKQELALSGKNVEALTWLGIVELADGHPELAVQPFDEAVELTPDDLTLLEYRGRAHNLTARDSYARMARIDPDAWQVHKINGELLAAYAEADKTREAIKEFNAAIARQPGNPDLYEELGDEQRKVNDLAGARTAYEKGMELSPGNAVAMYNLGSTEVELGDFAAGVPLLERVMEVYRSTPVAQYYLGRGLAGLGKDAEAAGWLEKSAAADPTGEIGKRSEYELVRVYRRLHRAADGEKALAEYNRLREAQEKAGAAQVANWRSIDAAKGRP